jgi:hypothetical protein
MHLLRERTGLALARQLGGAAWSSSLESTDDSLAHEKRAGNLTSCILAPSYQHYLFNHE